MPRVSIGLDIGTSAVKIVELQEGMPGTASQVTRWGMVPLPEGAVIDGVIKKKAAVSTALTELLKKTKIAARGMVTALPEGTTNLRLFKITLQNGQELTDMVKKEAAARLPQSIKDLNYDYQVVTDYGAGGKEVFFACASKEVVQGYLDAFRGAGIQPEAIDLHSLALIRVAGLLGREDNAVLDLGAGAGTLVIARKDVPVYTRMISGAGKVWTGALQTGAKLSIAEAEELKLLYTDALFEAETAPDPMGVQVNRTLQPKLADLAGELKKSLDFFRLQQPEAAPIQRLVVTGGGAGIKNLLPFLAQELQLETVRLDLAPEALKPPRETTPEEWKRIFPAISVALGLALREVVEN